MYAFGVRPSWNRQSATQERTSWKSRRCVLKREAGAEQRLDTGLSGLGGEPLVVIAKARVQDAEAARGSHRRRVIGGNQRRMS